MKQLDVIAVTQRDNKYDASYTCCPTSAAMAMVYMAGGDLNAEGKQNEDYIVEQSYALTDAEKNALTSVQGKWIWNYKPYQVLPIMEYVCNKIAQNFGFKVAMSWGISYDAVKQSIENGFPLIALADFSKVSKITGHYNCVIGYDEANGQQIITNDPWGNALTGYSDSNGAGMIYNWSYFNRGGGVSYGLTFSK